MDKVKNYVIAVLIPAVFGAFFYGKAQLPDPPAQSAEVVSQAASSDVSASLDSDKAKLKGTGIDLSISNCGPGKAKLKLKADSADIDVESLRQRLREQLQSMSEAFKVQSGAELADGYKAGIGYNFDQSAVYYKAGYLYHLGGKWFAEAESDFTYNGAVQVKQVGASLIKVN